MFDAATLQNVFKKKNTLHLSVFVLFIFTMNSAFSMSIDSNDPIVLQIPNVTSDPRGAETISIELDGYDVSSFAQLVGTQITVQLSVPLDSGAHDIVVLVFYANGDVDTLLEQKLNVQNDGAVNWNHAISINNTYRADEKESSDFADRPRYNSNGAVALEGSVTKQNWQLTTEFEALYDNNDSSNSSGREWDLPSYVVEASYQGVSHRAFVRAGDDFIGQESLVFSSYQRRGISTGLESMDGSYEVKGFVFNSDPTSSARYNLGYPSQQQERSVGLLASYAPFENSDILKVSVGYVDGQGTTSGTGFTAQGENTIYGGDSWNVILDSRLINGAMAVHAEYSESSFDSDGINQGSGEQTDNAWNTSIEYNAVAKTETAFLDQWLIGLKFEEVGAQYWSIANLGIVGDLTTEKLYYQGNKGGFGVTGELVQQKNNVADDPLIANQTADFFNMDFYYTPMNINTQTGIWEALGIPSFNAYVHFTKRQQDTSDISISGYDLDNLNSQYSLSANFTKDTWGWSIQHDQSWFDDESQAVVENGFQIYTPQSNSVNYLTTLQFNVMPSSRAYLALMLQWNVLEEDSSDNEFDTVNLGFNSQFQIIPDKWDLNLNYSFNENDNTYGDNLGVNNKQRYQTLSLETNWTAIEAKGRNAGLKLYLKGSYNHQEEVSLNQGDELYQVLVGFTLFWNKGN